MAETLDPADFAATPRRAYRYPLRTASDDVPRDLAYLAGQLDARASDFDPMTTTARNALAGADLYSGRAILNTSTGQVEVYSGGKWLPVAGGASSSMTFVRVGLVLAQVIETRPDGSQVVSTLRYSGDRLTSVTRTNPGRTETLTYNAAGALTGYATT